jgi:hypothetical protein
LLIAVPRLGAVVGGEPIECGEEPRSVFAQPYVLAAL